MLESFVEIREYRFFLTFPSCLFVVCVCKVSNNAFLPPLSTRLLCLVVTIPLAAKRHQTEEVFSRLLSKTRIRQAAIRNQKLHFYQFGVEP